MTTTPKESLSQALLNRRMLICALSGFSSGLPLFVLLSLLPAWLKSEGVDLKAIGLLALVQLPFNWKFLWSPLLDRYALPLLGRRRSWMLLMQTLLLLTIPGFGLLDPQAVMHSAHSPAWLHDGLASFFAGNRVMQPLLSLWSIAWLALALAFWGASQDIVLDAYRREILPDAELGLGNALFVNAYRIAGLVPGSLSLILADYTHNDWHTVFLVTGMFMLPGMLMTLFLAREMPAQGAPRTLRDSVALPFREFFQRQGIGRALLILLFLVLYKLGDGMATALATPFYLELGFTKTVIGLVVKNAGLWSSVAGAILGGIWMVKLGINRALWLFGLVQIFSILGFAWLATQGHAASKGDLALVVGLEALGVGLGTVAFVAFIARCSNPLYTATQLALFTSLAALPRTVVSAGTGFLVDYLGWPAFFVLCYALAIPGMLLLMRVAPWQEMPEKTPTEPAQ